jgi:hypothetical protein
MAKRKTGRSNPSGESTYDVGYAKPPVPSRFQPGKSGNPKGRPRGSRNLKTSLQEAYTASIAVTEAGKTRTVSKLVGVAMRQLQDGLNGDPRAAVAALKIASQIGLLDDERTNQSDGLQLTEKDQRVLEEWKTRQARKKG